MELTDAMRTAGAVRDFTDEPVSRELLWQVLDHARFAPSGGNQQGWRVVVLEDPHLRAQLRDAYLPAWYEYLAMRSAGIRPWAPPNDPAAEQRAIAEGAAPARAQAEAGGGGFAEHLDQVPVVLAVLVDLGTLAAVDRDAERYSFAGGASIYPFVWNLLLAARDLGLAGVMTTMAIREEATVLELLGAPEHHALAAVVALGHPVHQPRRLRRRPVEEFTTIDRVDGEPLRAPEPDRP